VIFTGAFGLFKVHRMVGRELNEGEMLCFKALSERKLYWLWPVLHTKHNPDGLQVTLEMMKFEL